jgi:hypothetical protein
VTTGGSNFSLKSDEQELCLLGSSENRVQGLSGNDIGEYEEDMLSDEVQGNQSNAMQQLGMVKCSQPSLLKHSVVHHMDVDVLDILGKGRNVDQIKDLIVSDPLGETMDQGSPENGSRGEAIVQEQDGKDDGGFKEGFLSMDNQRKLWSKLWDLR